MPDAAISVQALTKRYGDTLALDGLSFTVPAGKTVALLGGNGAGKSTTIAILLGLLTPSSGAVSILGHDIVRNHYAALPFLNFSSPYVDLPHRLTVRQNLAVYAGLYGLRRAKDRIVELADALDLTRFLDRHAGDLSAGQKTRVALAKALLNRPRVLLLDEPTASLDPDTADRMRTYLEIYQRATGATILLASHNMPEVQRMADWVLMMKGGKLMDEGTSDDLIEKHGRDNLDEVFLAIARSDGEDAT